MAAARRLVAARVTRCRAARRDNRAGRPRARQRAARPGRRARRARGARACSTTATASSPELSSAERLRSSATGPLACRTAIRACRGSTHLLSAQKPYSLLSLPASLSLSTAIIPRWRRRRSGTRSRGCCGTWPCCSGSGTCIHPFSVFGARAQITPRGDYPGGRSYRVISRVNTVDYPQ